MDFTKLQKFLTELKKNNNKEWFDANRNLYESLKKDWIAFTENCIVQVGEVDSRIANLEPKHCIFRINKDIRFSKDKTPYKTNFGMQLNPGGKKAEFMGYYLHIEPNQSFMAGGAYLPSPPTLSAIRQEIDYNGKSFLKVIENKKFVALFGNLDGEKLTRPPKGYDATNPLIEYLKYKSYIANRKLSNIELTEPKVMKVIKETAETMKPLIDFLSEARQ
jgi:uncharacterized protein (TIGR02453 family)